MRSIAVTVSLLVALVLAAGVLAGCGTSQADKARDQVCTARDDIAKEAKNLQGLTLTTATTSQVSDSLQAIKDDLSTISKATGDLSDERRKDVEAANEKFSADVKALAANVGKSVSIQGAAAQLKDAFRQLATSYQSTFGQLDCS
jgi:uncharacterized protein YgfB (UPF0149 family)